MKRNIGSKDKKLFFFLHQTLNMLNSAVYPGILTCGLFGFNASLQGVFGTSMLALFSSPGGCRLINTDKQTRLQAEVMLL